MAQRMCSVDGCETRHYGRGLCKRHYTAARIGGLLPRKPPITEAERFWSKVERQAGGCWVWTAYRNATGYGVFGGARGPSGKSANRLAHRVSYEMATGVNPGDLVVCHHCDNPPCVNPAHLFLGSRADNTAEMMAKGRHRAFSGDLNPRSKITEAQHLEILALRAKGEKLADIAAAYSLHASHVSRICSGKRRPSAALGVES